jgi:glycine cleavage system H protein
VRQGQKIVAMHRDGREIDLVSPIEGIVVNVNDKLRLDPDLARKDPYGEGWLIAVNAPDVATSFRNLLNGNVARRWMEESAATLRSFSPGALAMVAQDGGVALDDLAADLPDAEFKMMTSALFLT